MRLAAIKSATPVVGELLGIESKLGSLAPGGIADLVAADGDSLTDIGIPEKVGFVMKDDVAYKQ